MKYFAEYLKIMLLIVIDFILNVERNKFTRISRDNIE